MMRTLRLRIGLACVRNPKGNPKVKVLQSQARPRIAVYYIIQILLFQRGPLFQRGRPEAQNGCDFCMLPGYWPPKRHVLSSAL